LSGSAGSGEFRLRGSITPQGIAHLPAQVRHLIVVAFAEALPPIYAYPVPLLGIAFVLALLLPERPLRTHAHLDGSSPAGPPGPPGAGPDGPDGPAATEAGQAP
jgi:hypothetical protein